MAGQRIPMLIGLLATLPAWAAPLRASEGYSWDGAFGGGMRSFDLEWRTAAAPTSNGANPPFTARWEDIRAAEATVALGLHYDDRLHLRGEVGYGRITAGSSSISAYADDARSQTTYRSDQRSDGGDVLEALMALGVSVANAANTVRLLGEFGYLHSQQRLTLTDGVESTPAPGPYAGLDSRYQARWQGPWAGVSASWAVGGPWELTIGCRGALVDYRGELDLNLRTDLAHPRSIEQSGNGFAVAAGAGISCRMTRALGIQALIEREQWRIRDGHDRVHYASGASDDVPLLEARLSAVTLRCGLRWEY
jgi:hypothetical protein